jgi:hypothetical protein
MGSVSLGNVLAPHDTSPIAWFIVAAYFGAASLSFWAARAAQENGREWQFWSGCALLMVLLAFNKQLDLQSYVTTFGRSLAENEGWFRDRRGVQEVFILLLTIGTLPAIMTLWLWLRRSAAAVKTAAIGLVLLFAFIVMRAASFHHMDKWVTRNVAGMRSGWWLELLGITVTGLSAIAYARGNRGSVDKL